MTERILIVEDDPVFRSVLEDSLVCVGYEIDAVPDGKTALRHLRAHLPDLVILDLTLPDLDGFALCPLLQQVAKVPIIILSARGQKVDKIKGLGLGADDYVTKPTDLEELLARIQAVLRRARLTRTIGSDTVKIGRLKINFRTRRATSRQKQVCLTYHELKLLQYLAERREQVISRDELLRAVWGHVDLETTNRVVDQTIFRLRQKIEPDPHRPSFIRTAHGDGYCLNALEQLNPRDD